MDLFRELKTPQRVRHTGEWMRASAMALTLLCCAPAALAAPSTDDLAKLAQNPIANLISVPFQNNTNFDYGPGLDPV